GHPVALPRAGALRLRRPGLRPHDRVGVRTRPRRQAKVPPVEPGSRGPGRRRRTEETRMGDTPGDQLTPNGEADGRGGGSLLRFETRAIHAGQDPEPLYGAVNVPIFQTSTYAQES